MNKNNKMETVIIQTRRGNETKGVVGRIADWLMFAWPLPVTDERSHAQRNFASRRSAENIHAACKHTRLHGRRGRCTLHSSAPLSVARSVRPFVRPCARRRTYVSTQHATPLPSSLFPSPASMQPSILHHHHQQQQQPSSSRRRWSRTHPAPQRHWSFF